MSKKLTCFITLLLITFTGFAQLLTPFAENDTYDLGTDVHNHGYRIAAWRDGYIQCGIYWDNAPHQYMQLTYFLADGTQQWTKDYLLPEYDGLQGMAIASLTSEHFFVTGIAEKYDDFSRDIFFAKFDAQGDSVFFNVYQDTLDSWLIDLEVRKPDTLVALGYESLYSDNMECRVLLFKFDTLGTILDTYTSDWTHDFPRDLERKDPYWYVTGFRWNPVTEQSKTTIVRYTDSFSSLLWVPGSGINESGYCLLNFHDALYIISQKTVYFPPDPRSWTQQFIAKVNPLPNSYSIVTPFGEPALTTLVYNFSEMPLMKFSDELMVYPFGGEYQKQLYFFDEDLNIICSSHIFQGDSTYSSTMFDASLVGADQVVITGRTFSLEDVTDNLHYWTFLSADLNAFLSNECADYLNLTGETTETGIHMYPNPASDYVYIRAADLILSVVFTDLSGKSVHMVSEPALTQAVSLEDFTPGIYFVQVKTANGIETKKLIVH